MAEEPLLNGLEDIPIKTEPVDPLLEATLEPTELAGVIPKEFTAAATNGLHEDSDCEDIAFFTQIEVDNTRKCLENTRLIIKDFETQLDWHLQQYMTLRNIFNPRRSLSKNAQKGNDDASRRQDLLSISQLSAIIANHPEGNKKFIKRKGPIPNGGGGRKRRRNKESESEEESEYSEEESEDYDEDFDEEDIDDPGAPKTRPKRKGKGKKSDTDFVVPKDEIEEEIHELIVPKEERESDDEEEDEMDYDEEEEFEPEPEPPKTPAKRGRKPKAAADEGKKTPAKKSPKGKQGQKKLETIDLTNLKTCKVVLDRLQDEEDSQDSITEIKDESIDRDELNSLLQPKLIHSIENFSVDSEKPIFILKDDNVKQFDFNECKTSNVIITFENKETLPVFLFAKNVVNNVLNGSIQVVLKTVLDQHLDDK